MSQVSTYEFAEAQVVDVDDPERRGRVKVKCGALVAIDDAVPEWVEPWLPTAGEDRGWFFLPRPGDVVEIMYLSASSTDAVRGQSFMFNPRYRYVASRQRTKAHIPKEFAGAKYGKRVGIKAAPDGASLGPLLSFDTQTTEAALRAKKVRLGSLEAGEKAVVGESYKAFLTELLSDLEAVKNAAKLAAQYLAPMVSATGDISGGLKLTAASVALTTTDIAGYASDIDGHLSDVVTIAKEEETG